MVLDPTYKPFLIADFKVGKLLNKKPWLIPMQAFKRVENGYFRFGVLSKRNGTSVFGQIAHFADDEALGTTVDLQLTYTGTLTHYPVEAGRLAIESSHESFSDNGDGTLTGASGGTGTIDYTTGDWSITFNSNPGNGVAITADYHYFPSLPVMGIFNYHTAGGTSQLVAIDTKRFTYWDAANEYFVDPVGSDSFTGDDDHYFWDEIFLDKQYIANNKDKIHEWDGTSLTEKTISFGAPAVEVNTCLLIFKIKGRMVLLRTTEDGDTQPQRARWSKVGAFDFSNDGYVDAPTNDWIMGADYLGDDLIVWFERSVWMLVYTADSRLPFRWKRLVESEGCYATMAVTAFSDEVIALGPVSMLSCDGMDVYEIDEKIPEYVLEINQQGFGYCFSAFLEELDQHWLLHPTPASTYSDKVLVLNYKENNWSTYLMSVHCVGYWDRDDDITWDTAPDDATWDSGPLAERTWDERTTQAGYPISLGGLTNGKVVELNVGGDDQGAAIAFLAESGLWNPYEDQGIGAHLGPLDFLVDRDPGITFDVECYLGDASTPYLTLTYQCDDPNAEPYAETVWTRGFVNCVGGSHRIIIKNNAIDQTLKIHAIRPGFKPGQ